MTENQAKHLVNYGAIEKIVIVEQPPTTPGWNVWLYGDEFQSMSEPVETTRGELRRWALLDSAVKWVKSIDQGEAIRIEVEYARG